MKKNIGSTSHLKNYVVWLDSKIAHIYLMNPTGVDKSIVERNEKDHHTRHKNDIRNDSNAGHFYRDLATALKEADQILLVGPGLAKNHFKGHLTSHKGSELMKKIIGMENFESFEHKTENQMMASVHEFFKSYNLFHSPISAAKA